MSVYEIVVVFWVVFFFNTNSIVLIHSSMCQYF